MPIQLLNDSYEIVCLLEMGEASVQSQHTYGCLIGGIIGGDGSKVSGTTHTLAIATKPQPNVREHAGLLA
jgi:hypothetical protein